MTVTPISSGRYSAKSAISGLSIPKHDYAELSYTGTDLTGVTYKLGGAWNDTTNTYTGGSTVGQLKLVYSAGNLVKIAEV
jgi:hypothetical protein